MSSSTRASSPAARAAALLALALGLALAGCDGCGDEGLPDPTAPVVGTLKVVGGAVEVQREGRWVLVGGDTDVTVSDKVRTREGAKATLQLADGTTVILEGGTEIDLASQEGGGYVLQLGDGEIELEGESEGGVRLALGDGEVVVVEGGGRVKATRGEGGIALRLVDGDAAVERDGERVPIVEGSDLVLTLGAAGVEIERPDAVALVEGDAGVEPGGPDATQGDRGPEAGDAADTGDASDVADAADAGDAADVDAEVGPAPAGGGAVTLVDPKRSARVKVPGDKRFRRPQDKELPLEDGTEVKGGRGTSLREPGGGRVELSRGTQVVSRGIASGAMRVGLSGGTTRLRLKPRGETKAGVVQTPHAKVRVTGKGATTDVQIRANRKSTRITVRVGSAEVRAGEKTVELGAGQRLEVGEDEELGAPRSLPTPRVTAREGRTMIVYYDRRPGRVGFTWDRKSADESYIVEIADTEAFEKVFVSEPVAGNTFSYGGLPGGRSYWRVKRISSPGAAPIAGLPTRVSLTTDPTLGAKKKSYSNLVRDTGVHTRIYFQGEEPSLHFSWDDFEGAARYRVRVFKASNLDSPVVDKRVTRPKMGLPARSLREGTYFWYQTALGARGQELKTGQMNKLSITFDNAAPLLRIDRPRSGQAVGGSAKVTGVVAAGVPTSVNGQPLRAKGDGRFSQTVSGIGDALVFHLKRGKSDVFFLRHVK